MLPARESQHKVIQDMHERHPGNGESDSEQQNRRAR
jgi:hypothetical protein